MPGNDELQIPTIPDETTSEAVLRMPKKPAIELVDSRALGLHALFSLLTTLGMSFAAAMWTAWATCDVSTWVLAAAGMLTALALAFLVLAIGAYVRMNSKKHNVEVPLKSIGDFSRVVRQQYLGSFDDDDA